MPQIKIPAVYYRGGTSKAVKALGARQALHAYRLSFVHPKTGETVSFETLSEIW